MTAAALAERFFKAIGKGDEVTALELVGEAPSLVAEEGAAKSPVYNKEATALLMAAELGLSRVAEALVRNGADLEARGALGGMALHWAAWQGHAVIVRLLVRAGSPLEAIDNTFDCTPLFWAVHGFSYHGEALRRDQIGAAKFLLEAGARPDAHNRQKTSALDILSDPADAPMKILLSETLERWTPNTSA